MALSEKAKAARDRLRGTPTNNAVNTVDPELMQRRIDQSLLANIAMTSRQDILERLMDPRRDINAECGYPDQIDIHNYRTMYEREIGNRVVSIYPDESWRQMPEITETDDPDPDNETEFEAAWKSLDKRRHALHFLQRIDELSGIGHFGLLLMGLDDGKPLSEPVDGVAEYLRARAFEEEPPTPVERKLLYIRALDESLVAIDSYETDPTNYRFGQPVFYLITLADPRTQPAEALTSPPEQTEVKVHWTRVLHVADNRTTSEVLGTPRQQPVWNRLYDLRKILGGDGEMFWRGGFPGISLESHPAIEDPELDEEATAAMMRSYMNGMQRYLALTGMTAKSLAPQIADPSPSFDVQIKALCVIIGVPYRVFMGTEEGKLAGEQDSDAWDGRMARRQERYITPWLINPFVELCMAYGVLPHLEEWIVTWPDAHAPSEMDQAEVAAKKTEAFAKYLQGAVDTLIPPMEFLTIICGLDEDVADQIITAALEHIEDKATEDATPGQEKPVDETGADIEKEGQLSEIRTKEQIAIEEAKAKAKAPPKPGA